jgi:hypothetical protein
MLLLNIIVYKIGGFDVELTDCLLLHSVWISPSYPYSLIQDTDLGLFCCIRVRIQVFDYETLKVAWFGKN